MNNDIIVGGVYKFEPSVDPPSGHLPGIVEVIEGACRDDDWFVVRVIEGVKPKETDEWCDIIVQKDSLFHRCMYLIDDPQESFVTAANNHELSFDDAFYGLDCCS